MVETLMLPEAKQEYKRQAGVGMMYCKYWKQPFGERASNAAILADDRHTVPHVHWHNQRGPASCMRQSILGASLYHLSLVQSLQGAHGLSRGRRFVMTGARRHSAHTTEL